jgi:hypothetical protein
VETGRPVLLDVNGPVLLDVNGPVLLDVNVLDVNGPVLLDVNGLAITVHGKPHRSATAPQYRRSLLSQRHGGPTHTPRARAHSRSFAHPRRPP